MSEFEWVWRCVVCEKPVDIAKGAAGDDSAGRLPCIAGGHLALWFGWFSSHDEIRALHHNHKRQGCICDDCFKKKHHCFRTVRIRHGHDSWEPIKS